MTPKPDAQAGWADNYVTQEAATKPTACQKYKLCVPETYFKYYEKNACTESKLCIHVVNVPLSIVS